MLKTITNYLSIAIYIYVFNVLFSCTQSEKTILDNPVFGVKEDIVGQVKTSSVDLLVPTSMVIGPNKLIITDPSSDLIFKVFELSSLNFLYSAGKKGDGPEELQAPFEESVFISNDILEIQDNNKIKRYRITDQGFEYLGYELLPIIGNPINGLTKLDDTRYVADNNMQDNSAELIMISSTDSEVTSKFGKYYDDGFTFNNQFDRYQTYKKSLTANDEANKIMALYLFFNRFKIFDFDGQLIKDITISEDKYSIYRFDSERINANIMYQTLPFSNSEHIFTMELGKAKEEVFNQANSLKPVINVWNWEGSPIARLTLDHFITSFVVHDNKLYGTSITEANKIFVYELPALNRAKNNKPTSLQPIKTNRFETVMPSGYESLKEIQYFKQKGFDCFEQSFYNTAVGGRCPGSIRLRVYSSEDGPISFDRYENVYGLEMFGKFDSFLPSSDNQDLPDIYTFQRTIDYTDPRGIKNKLNTKIWVWTNGSKIIQISYSTCSDPNDLDSSIPELVRNTSII